MKKILFILKRREDYNSILHSKIGLSTGLYNSSKFIDDMLNSSNINSKLSVVIDNDSIDREVSEYKPTHVIIEALWVVPTKFDILQKLHPDVKWIIRLHSETPFLAGEGIAMDWIGDYLRYRNVMIACNAPRIFNEVKHYAKMINDKFFADKVIYLPNYYPIERNYKDYDNDDIINISCFGAIRPLKNHLLQALSAIQFADEIGKKLRFHINDGRIEMQGKPVKDNVKSLFQHIEESGHVLINHSWLNRDDFLQICSMMDIGLQVSLTETFNIVGADHIQVGVPVILTNNEMPWSNSFFDVKVPTNSKEIVEKLHQTHKYPLENVSEHQTSLINYINISKQIWIKEFK